MTIPKRAVMEAAAAFEKHQKCWREHAGNIRPAMKDALTAAAPFLAGPTREEVARVIVAGIFVPLQLNETLQERSLKVADAVLALLPAQAETLPVHTQLLGDINDAAHAEGTNAAVRDVLACASSNTQVCAARDAGRAGTSVAADRDATRGPKAIRRCG